MLSAYKRKHFCCGFLNRTPMCGASFLNHCIKLQAGAPMGNDVISHHSHFRVVYISKVQSQIIMEDPVVMIIGREIFFYKFPHFVVRFILNQTFLVVAY